MAGVNRATILGHLGRDPEMKYSQSGTAVCRFSVAVTEKYNGNEQTEWFNCVAFSKLAEIVNQYLAKGSQAYIEGRIQTRKYQTKDGSDRYSTEIIVGNLVMLGNGKSAGSATGARQSDGKSGGKPSQRGMGFDGRDARSARPADDDPFSGDFGPPPTDDDMPF